MKACRIGSGLNVGMLGFGNGYAIIWVLESYKHVKGVMSFIGHTNRQTGKNPSSGVGSGSSVITLRLAEYTVGNVALDYGDGLVSELGLIMETLFQHRRSNSKVARKEKNTFVGSEKFVTFIGG